MNKKIQSLVEMYENICELRARLYEAITNAAEGDKSGVFNGLDYIADGEITATEFMEENADSFENDAVIETDGDSDFSVPVISIDTNGLYVTVSQKVDGGNLVAGICESDCGTYQSVLMYRNEENTEIDLALAEVKRGELAETHGMSENNKDVDLYVWSDPLTEDYQSEYTLKYSELSKPSQE